MAGRKHTLDGSEAPSFTDKPSSPYIPQFEFFRSELDAHHDRRERIVKASRDITASSKKIIFSLQRVRTVNQPIPPSIHRDTSPRYEQITTLFTSIASDLSGPNAHRYAWQISSGIQEYIEAISFSHYLTTSTLLTYTEAQSNLSSMLGEGWVLPYEEYLLGIFDLVGEVMRFAITTMATTGEIPKTEDGRDVVGDLRQIRRAFEGLETGQADVGFKKDVQTKMTIMRTCVEKVEGAVYGMIIRGRERPKGWVPEFSGGGAGRTEVEGY